jgi:hypothetical protein
MLATLVEVKFCSKPGYWYRDKIGQRFWIDMASDPDGWHRCVLDRSLLFHDVVKYIDYNVIAEADIDIVSTIHVNKVLIGEVNNALKSTHDASTQKPQSL